MNPDFCTLLFPAALQPAYSRHFAYGGASLRTCPQVTNEGLALIGQHCTTLSHIEIACNARITADGIVALCSRTRLTHVVLNDCPRIRDSAAAALAQKPLVYLDVCGCKGLSDATLKMLAQGGAARTSLSVMKLANLPRVTDTGVRHFGRGCANAFHIDLSHCTNLTDASMSVLLSHAVYLRELNLAGCDKVSDGTLLALQANNIDSLQWLDLTECISLTDHGVEALGDATPFLQHLSLAGCTGITDEAFKELVFGCQVLEWLSIAYCPQLSDRALELIGTGCKSLRTLHLFGVTNITSGAFERLLGTCSSLRTLSVSSSTQISRSAIQRARRTYPRLRIHFDMDEPTFETQMPLRTFYSPETVGDFG